MLLSKRTVKHAVLQDASPFEKADGVLVLKCFEAFNVVPSTYSCSECDRDFEMKPRVTKSRKQNGANADKSVCYIWRNRVKSDCALCGGGNHTPTVVSETPHHWTASPPRIGEISPMSW